MGYAQQIQDQVAENELLKSKKKAMAEKKAALKASNGTGPRAGPSLATGGTSLFSSKSGQLSSSSAAAPPPSTSKPKKKVAKINNILAPPSEDEEEDDDLELMDEDAN